MGQYLDKFKDAIGKRQTQQILKVLNRKRNTGQIRSLDEFSSELESLMRELTETSLTPSLQMWMAREDELIDSETYNFMLERVQDDLEAAFEEAINIDEVQRSHEAIIRDVILKNLRAGVAELDSKITLFEFLNKDVRGFDSAIFSTFRESKENRTERGGSLTTVLFADPRRGDLIRSSQDATVELVGERLVLANNEKVFHPVRNIRQIFDSNTPQSELVVEPPGVTLRNVIDGLKGTYWIQSLLFSNKRPAVQIQLELDLGATKEVNFIDIEPATRYGIILQDISYVDGNNVVTNLNIDEQVLESEASIRIRKVATKRLILTFRNENSSRVQFKYSDKNQPLFSQAIIEPPEGIQPTSISAAADLQELLASTKVKDVLGLPTEDKQTFSGYEFLSGFDNIRVGLATFQSRSVYVSSPLDICGAGELGLKVKEVRPFIPVPSGLLQFSENTYDNNSENEAGGISSRSFLGSIEYWIIKQDLSSEGALLRTSIFPILPLGVDRIHHERLVLNEKSSSGLVSNDTGTLMFFTNASDGNLKLYRNFSVTPMIDNTGVGGATTGYIVLDDAALRTPDNGKRMVLKIRILDPLAGDIFTASYTPLLSSTKALPQTISEFTALGGLKVVDLVGDLSARVGEEQIVLLDRVGEDGENLVSRIFLSVILRQNTADISASPAVEEYTLVSGCKDQSKFEEI